jgi:hypothetical protein
MMTTETATARPTKQEIDSVAAGLSWNKARIVYLTWWLTDPKLAKRHAMLREELSIYENAADKPWPVLAAELTGMRKRLRRK